METNPIPDIPVQYLATNRGTILNTQTGRELRGSPDSWGYWVVSLCDSGRATSYKLATLICLAFHGPRPKAWMEVCHNDGDKNNNTPNNLRWDTHVGNIADNVRLGKLGRGNRKLTDAQRSEIRKAAPQAKADVHRLAERYQVNPDTIRNVVRYDGTGR